jgi:hypothetical protein
MSSTLAPSIAQSMLVATHRPHRGLGGENGAHVLRAAAVLAPLVQERVHVYSAIEPRPVEMLDSEPIVLPPDIEESRKIHASSISTPRSPSSRARSPAGSSRWSTATR